MRAIQKGYEMREVSTKTDFSSYEELEKAFADSNSWGLLTSLDLKNCHPDLVRSKEAIHQYIIEACDLIDMKRFGDPTIINFGEDERVAGFSMAQFIETSMISGHFANMTNNVYLDVFSCKIYNPYILSKFSKEYFKAQDFEMHFILRK